MKRKHKDDRKRRDAARRRRRRLVIALVAVGAVAVVLLAASLVWPRLARRGAHPGRGRETLTPQALMDSTRAAVAARDWATALRWSERLAATDPRDARYLQNLALSVHNLAWLGSAYRRERSATRTSLERVTLDRRALTLLDSATACARTEDERVNAWRWYGQTLENLGLPCDALQSYVGILKREPGFTPAASRMTWVLQSLRDPLGAAAAPDSALR